MSIADFFADNFVSNLAYVLGIDTARIKVVSIKAGSVLVDWEVRARFGLLTGRRARFELLIGNLKSRSDGV